VVCGDGAQMAAAQWRAAQSAVAESIEFTGWLSPQEVSALLDDADLLVLPTLREGFPSALLEGMAAGLPIVTTPVGGIPDHLRDGIHARFVQPRSPDALAAALVEVLEDADLRARMSQANLELVREFAPERVIPVYLRAMQQACSGHT